LVYSNVSQRKQKTGPMVIVKATSFYDKMEMTDTCTFSESSNGKLSVQVLSGNPE